MTIASKVSKRSVERAFPLRNDKYILSNLKELVSDKLEQRKRESKSRDRSYDRNANTNNKNDHFEDKSASRDQENENYRRKTDFIFDSRSYVCMGRIYQQ